MNKARDNQIIRDIIDFRIPELYCIKEGYYEKYHHPIAGKHTLGKKYSVFPEPKHSMGKYRRLKTNWWDEETYELPIQTIFITDNNGQKIKLITDSAISEYFDVEYSLKKIRKEKIKRLRSYEF